MDKYDKNKGLRINEQIKAEKVRLVGDEDSAIVSVRDAIAKAKEQSLDLVEVSPNQDPPVVKIMDYSRYVFDQRKRTKDNKKKQKVIHLKEIKLRPAIAENDYVHKLNQAKGFLEKGDKVKFSIKFRGREIVHSELGFNLLNRVIEDLKGLMQLEQQPMREGKSLSMVAIPATGSKKKKKKEHEHEPEDSHEAGSEHGEEDAQGADADIDEQEEQSTG